MAAKTKRSKPSRSPKTMAELLAQTGYQLKSLSTGDKIRAKFIRILKDRAIFDVGGKSEGVVRDEYFSQAKDFLSHLKPGAELEAIILEPETKEGLTLLSLQSLVQKSSWDRLEKAQKEDRAISVVGRNITPKGLMVEVYALTGFIPMSHLGKKVIKNLSGLIDKQFPAKVVDLNESKNKIVLSEKAISEAEDIKLLKEAMQKLELGKIYAGRVQQLANFGVFVEIKSKVGQKQIPVEGLVHISELSWDKVQKPSEIVQEGDRVKVKVISKEDNKLALSLKQAQEDPWKNISKYKKDARVKGKIVRVSDFGIFVSLEPGIEGLIHITKIPPTKKLEVGQKVDCYIEEIDAKDRRLSLGLVLTEKPVGYK